MRVRPWAQEYLKAGGVHNCRYQSDFLLKNQTSSEPVPFLRATGNGAVNFIGNNIFARVDQFADLGNASANIVGNFVAPPEPNAYFTMFRLRVLERVPPHLQPQILGALVELQREVSDEGKGRKFGELVATCRDVMDIVGHLLAGLKFFLFPPRDF